MAADTDALRAMVIAGLTSTSDAAGGWNAIVRRTLTAAAVQQLSDKEVQVTFGAAPAYSIAAPETVVVTLAAQLLSSQEKIVAAPSLRIAARPGVAELYGPLQARANEAFVKSATGRANASEPGDAQLRIRVSGGDGWLDAVGSDSAATTALLQALRSDQEEDYGWNAIVLPSLTDADVSVDGYGADGDGSGGGGGVVTVRLPMLCAGCAGYEISSPETIRLTVPAAALLADAPIVASGSIVVNASGGTLDFAGELSAGATEAELTDVTPRALRLVLSGDQWEGRLGQASFGPTLELLGGLRARGAEASGWASIVQRSLGASAVSRVDDETVELIIPQAAAYDIYAPEVIDAVVPATAVLSRQQPTLTAPLTILASAGRASLIGGLVARPEEGALQAAGGTYYNVTLTADSWVATSRDSRLAALVAGMASEQPDEPAGWNAIVRPQLQKDDLLRADDRTLTWRLPPRADYALAAPETVAVTLPAAAVLSGRAIDARWPLVLARRPPPRGRARARGE